MKLVVKAITLLTLSFVIHVHADDKKTIFDSKDDIAFENHPVWESKVMKQLYKVNSLARQSRSKKLCFKEFCSNSGRSIFKKYGDDKSGEFIIKKKLEGFPYLIEIIGVNHKDRNGVYGLGVLRFKVENYDLTKHPLSFLESYFSIKDLKVKEDLSYQMKARGCFKEFFMTEITYFKEIKRMTIELFDTNKDNCLELQYIEELKKSGELGV